MNNKLDLLRLHCSCPQVIRLLGKSTQPFCRAGDIGLFAGLGWPATIQSTHGVVEDPVFPDHPSAAFGVAGGTGAADVGRWMQHGPVGCPDVDEADGSVLLTGSRPFFNRCHP